MNVRNIIITCFLAPAIYEILKHIVFSICDKIRENGMPYVITGYWVAYHSSKFGDGSEYAAFELIKIKQKNDKLFAKLFQLTDDERFYTYNCKGYIKGNKVVLSYCEANSSLSNAVGTFNLLRKEQLQHLPCFYGVYSEFIKDNRECSSSAYKLFPYKVPVFNRVLIYLLKSKYVRRYMRKE